MAPRSPDPLLDPLATCLFLLLEREKGRRRKGRTGGKRERGQNHCLNSSVLMPRTTDTRTYLRLCVHSCTYTGDDMCTHVCVQICTRPCRGRHPCSHARTTTRAPLTRVGVQRCSGAQREKNVSVCVYVCVCVRACAGSGGFNPTTVPTAPSLPGCLLRTFTK